ncbi:MAG: L,D-transpeptidase [Rhizobiaceae bacterium]|nr:L,D-transpeptidase [Rhizobiaceae bacterium]
MLRIIGLALAMVTAAVSFQPAAAQDRPGFLQSLFEGNQNRSSAKHPVRSDKSPIARKVVRYDGPYGPGTIIVNTSERRLYYTLGNGKAMRYGVGVGRDGFTWAGTNRVSRKAEWPGWTPPPQMIRREAAKGRKLPPYMAGGPENPLGARALYIGSTMYRIHGTNQPWTIGQAMSSGCIRMANDDVVHLYNQVNVGDKVVVVH